MGESGSGQGLRRQSHLVAIAIANPHDFTDDSAINESVRLAVALNRKPSGCFDISLVPDTLAAQPGAPRSVSNVATVSDTHGQVKRGSSRLERTATAKNRRRRAAGAG